MKRREFLTLAGSGAVWPLVALAQQKPRPVIGFISSGAPDPSGDRVRAFKQGLQENGFVEGQNVDFEYRWAGAENNS
jgi:putative ABC transport system substrate-binding protein